LQQIGSVVFVQKNAHSIQAFGSKLVSIADRAGTSGQERTVCCDV